MKRTSCQEADGWNMTTCRFKVQDDTDDEWEVIYWLHPNCARKQTIAAEVVHFCDAV